MNLYMTTLYNLGDDYPIYKDCYNMSRDSVFNFMPYFDEHVLIEGKGGTPFEMLLNTYNAIMDESMAGNNVFYMEIDCIMVKPVENVFKSFNKFELFARTSPASIKYNNMRFDPYMNSGVKYIPGDLPLPLIKKADDMMKEYDTSFWGFDQLVFNRIFYEQHERAYPMREDLNYMPFPDVIRHIKEEDAKIIHLCSSRGVLDCYNKMKVYYDKFVRK